MAWNFRKSKKIGGVRFTLGKNGVSASVGNSVRRYSVNSRGQVHRTTSLPGTGLYNRERINGGAQQAKAPSYDTFAEFASEEPEAFEEALEATAQTVECRVQDVTGGKLTLWPNGKNIEDWEVVCVTPDVLDLALTVAGTGEYRALLRQNPNGEVGVYVMFGVKGGTEQAVPCGRLSAKYARKVVELAGSDDVIAACFLSRKGIRLSVDLNEFE